MFNFTRILLLGIYHTGHGINFPFFTEFQIRIKHRSVFFFLSAHGFIPFLYLQYNRFGFTCQHFLVKKCINKCTDCKTENKNRNESNKTIESLLLANPFKFFGVITYWGMVSHIFLSFSHLL